MQSKLYWVGGALMAYAYVWVWVFESENKNTYRGDLVPHLRAKRGGVAKQVAQSTLLCRHSHPKCRKFCVAASPEYHEATKF